MPIKIWNYPTFPILQLHDFYQKSPVKGGYLELDTRTEEGWRTEILASSIELIVVWIRIKNIQISQWSNFSFKLVMLGSWNFDRIFLKTSTTLSWNIVNKKSSHRVKVGLSEDCILLREGVPEQRYPASLKGVQKKPSCWHN